MSFFDLLGELRKGVPDIAKAARAMKTLGWICVLGAVWNYVIFYIGPFDQVPFNLPQDFPYIALVSLSFLGALFLLSSRGIKAMEPWGKKLAQFGVVLLLGLIIGFSGYLLSLKEFSGFREEIPVVFGIFVIVFIAQFGLPAYFGIRYLGRLPVNDSNYAGRTYRTGTLSQAARPELGRETSLTGKTYKEAFFPFGIYGTLWRFA